jgi:hypothetical protein
VYGQINESLEAIVTRLDEAILVEAHNDLIDLMESVGYELEAETVEEALEAVAAFIESEEFEELSEADQNKVKEGFKMVFGKLRRLGKEIGGAAKSGELSQAAREAYRSAKGKVGKAFGKTGVGKAVNKAAEKFSGTKAGAALGKHLAKKQMQRHAGDEKRKAGIKDYWKKNAGK